ncbi:hypothetical protein NKDENANG_02450 [Candidatus Entotheonellaceae bacterium PAL068K]
MLEELDEMRRAVQSGDYRQALALIDEMEEMSRDDKINKVMSDMRILLTHLIKQAAEKRSTRSWENSIDEAIFSIVTSNKRRRSGGHYLNDDELMAALAEIHPRALKWAAQEAFEGMYATAQIASMVGRDDLLESAFQQIKQAQ